MMTMEEQIRTPTEHKIGFPSRMENMTLVEKFIDDVCEDYNINEDYYGNILIALTEAVNNAIRHGNKLDPEKNITVTFDSRGNVLLFAVEDEGSGFNFDTLPDPTDPANIEKPHGRGVFLMRNLADEVTFDNNGRRVELHFRLAV